MGARTLDESHDLRNGLVEGSPELFVQCALTSPAASYQLDDQRHPPNNVGGVFSVM